ncbi:putative mfs general substrate transporter protein [Phaeoacremonium minimum UCRPA7]|uniref:Putative mfs general substrate transporter protein n=1 Tax=Phaeoacremonium minimum (strain UCR-PA7) TaxID=1286976 RepID=R8BLT8_PHAM7|nr:putative mfs general substrate transporter protein [Phaeoacremonium minimum UCRPA7]EOO00318.1 putative mfs general substrate transporter protein [Phaeoacremonium minimum UCRPA7]
MSSISYYVKNIFASSYGNDRPAFFIWHPKGTSSSEKKLLFKIDFFILTYGCLAYFAKWLDQANLSNAYVSGMKEDLEMFGTEFNLATTCFQVGQILGPIPANILLTWIPPRMLLPGLEFIWAILTIGTYAVTSVHQLYPIRFFIGFLEGSCFVGIQYVLGSWYKKSELGKRTAIFACAAYVGTMISGYLQSAVLAGMDGKHGLEAWRWVFIIDGIITVIVALYGFIFFPDTPYNTKAFYLSEDEKARCVERLAEDGRTETTNFTWSLFWRTLNSWQLYVLTVLWMFWNTTVGKVANTVMQLYLKNDKEHTWSLYQVNNIPTAINGFNIVMVLLLNIFIDTTGYRMRAVALNLCILLFGTICLVVWNIPLGLRIVSYMFAGLDGPLSPIYYSWANILTTGDTQVRALVLAIMNSCGAALTTVIQQFLYPVTDAPKYPKGFKASLGFICGMCIWVVVVRIFEMRSLRKAQVVEAAEGNSETSDSSPTSLGVTMDQKV